MFFRSFTLCVCFYGFIHASELFTLMWATVSACAICLVFPSNFVFFNVFCAQINGGGDGDFTCNHGIRAAPLTSGVAR